MIRYGIERFDAVNWISDRGSNLIRCFNLNIVEPIFCFAHRIHNVLTITFLNKKLDISFIDEDFEEIPDDLVQEKYLGDEAKTLSIKKILSTIVSTKTLVRYVKAVS